MKKLHTVWNVMKVALELLLVVLLVVYLKEYRENALSEIDEA